MTASRGAQFRRYFRPNCGVRLVALLDPGGLDGLQDLLTGAVGVVLEPRKLHHPAMQVGKPQVDVVDAGVAFLELYRDILDIGPAQLARHRPPPTCRPSCCGSQPAGAPPVRPVPRSSESGNPGGKCG